MQMRNKLHKMGVVLLLGALVAACGKVPDGVLTEKQMQAVQVDMQLAEAIVNNTGGSFPDDAHKEALYQSIFRKHKITQAVYDSSLVWYGRNLDVYMKVYDRISADLEKRIKDLGDVQANVVTVNTDSVDIWALRTNFTFEPKAIFNGITFNINPETNYSSGSSFVLGMNIWGLNAKMRHTPEVRLSVDQGDTILTVNHIITEDGYSETILRSLPTKQIKRVFGYIRLNNSDSTSYYKVYADSLNLMRYKYGSLTELKDSIQ